jgi:hypothetical protein
MRVTILAVLLALVVTGAVMAAEPSATAVVCASVKDRAPVGAADKFPATVGQVYCFTEAKSVGDKVVMVWFHADKEVGRVDLPCKADRWRTWSAKKVLPGMAGAWKVEVQDGAGKVLATAAFTVE